jgi:hypothetical protein
MWHLEPGPEVFLFPLGLRGEIKKGKEFAKWL